MTFSGGQLSLGILFASALVGCGGGGSSSNDPGPTAEGVYGGTLTGSSSSAFQMLVLEDGDFWTLYGVQTTTAFGVAGFVQGSGTSSGGTFTSSSAKDFGFTPALAGTASASFDATAKTIAGTVSSSGRSVGFNGGPIAGSLYNYAAPALLSTISGAWSLTTLANEGVALTVASTGAFTARTSLGCTFSGSFVPRPSGKNVFNVSLTFGPSPCALAGQPASGIAINYPLASGRSQLVIAGVDAARNIGTAAFGTR